jgi:hypothetical protein
MLLTLRLMLEGAALRADRECTAGEFAHSISGGKDMAIQNAGWGCHHPAPSVVLAVLGPAAPVGLDITVLSAPCPFAASACCATDAPAAWLAGLAKTGGAGGADGTGGADGVEKSEPMA